MKGTNFDCFWCNKEFQPKTGELVWFCSISCRDSMKAHYSEIISGVKE